MKGFLSSTLLVATSLLGAAAAADPSPSSSSSPSALAPLLASLHVRAVAVGDFDFDFGALQCTADLSTGDVTDEAGCKTATDGDGLPCVWCDASALLGQGACVSADVKSMAGQFWDQLCGDDAASGSDPVSVPHDSNGGGVPDELRCTLDASSNLVADEASCVARTDATSADPGARCVWCDVPLLGGTCITNGDRSSVSFLCSGEEGGNGGEKQLLRGAAVE